jgi:SHS2 domain-containing protein
VLEAEKFSITISTREYYNFVRKMITDKDQPQTINRLLMTFQEEGFVYKTRVKIEENNDGVTIKRKMIQI